MTITDAIGLVVLFVVISYGVMAFFEARHQKRHKKFMAEILGYREEETEHE